jgi:hypothetical protein
VKPQVPKQFRASVYARFGDLDHETRGLPPEAPLLVSEVVRLEGEARAWVLDGRVLTCAVYEGAAGASEAIELALDVASRADLPRSCAVDVGLIAGRGWGLLEANAAWGSGLNGCDPTKAARCIAFASMLARSPSPGL